MGVVAGAGDLDIVQICALLTVMSILGDQSGYFWATAPVPAIFSRPDSLLFKQEYVTRTQAFYEKHGGKTLIYAKFVPIVRTFAPFMAGVGRMRYARFLSFNIFGGIGWVLSMTLAGIQPGQRAVGAAEFRKSGDRDRAGQRAADGDALFPVAKALSGREWTRINANSRTGTRRTAKRRIEPRR